jgi:hypothetical protein
MTRYLDKFVSTIPAVQGKQITEILNTKKDRGEIRTIKEYSKEADRLFEVLTASDPLPTLKLFLGEKDKSIFSETFNFMMERVIDDLTTVFQEAKNIADVATLHRRLIIETILRSLRFAIHSLNDTINVHEFLSNNKDGFTAAQFNSFTQDNLLRTARTDAVASATYVDPITGLLVSTAEDAVVDPIGEQLLLSTSLNKQIALKNIRLILDADTRASEIDISFPGSDIRNAIDNQDNTFWVHDILLTDPEPDGVLTKVELKLAGVQDINFIELEPATLFKFSLTEMSYVDTSGNVRRIPLSETLLDRPRRINFTKITTNTILLTCKQRTYLRARYAFNANTQSYERLIAQDPITLEDVDFTTVEQELGDLIDSATLKEAIGVTSSAFNFEDVDMYEYLIGFDNIRIGLNQYNNRGIYVGAKLTADQPGVMGLKAVEVRNQHEFLGLDIDSIEYTIYKQNFDVNNIFVDTEIFNILPISITAISQERLLLRERTALSNDTGTFRFYPDVSKTLKVYRDGTELIIGTDYQVSGDSGASYQAVLSLSVHDPGNQFHEFKVQVVNPADTSIYTVDYEPLLDVFVNSRRTATIKNGNLFNFNLNRPNITVNRSDIFLTIILRRNHSNIAITPELKEYNLLVGSIDKTRFTGDELS